jgi:hypothetical protein
MSKFLEDCKLKLDKWVEDRKAKKALLLAVYI